MRPVPFDSAQRLGAVVRREREHSGRSQTELATAAGVTRQWLVLFETGRLANPTLSNVLKVTATLGLELEVRGRQEPTATDLTDLMGRP